MEFRLLSPSGGLTIGLVAIIPRNPTRPTTEIYRLEGRES